MNAAKTEEQAPRSQDATTLALRWIAAELMESALTCEDPAFVETRLVLCDVLWIARAYVAHGTDPVAWLARLRGNGTWTAMGRHWARRLAERLGREVSYGVACPKCAAAIDQTYGDPGDVVYVCAGPARHVHHEVES